MSRKDQLSRSDIENLLNILSRRLTAIGIEADIEVMGGAAMSLAYFPERDVTRDIDATLPRLWKCLSRKGRLSPCRR